MDLDDHHGNTKDGIHAANMAGSWLGIVAGFGGFRAFGDEILFSPRIPQNWNRYSFKINYRQRLIKVDVNKEKVTLQLIKGSLIKVKLYDEEVQLEDKIERNLAN